MIYIRQHDRELFPVMSDDNRTNILASCLDMVDNIIKTNNLTDLEKVWLILSDDIKKSYFNNYVNLFYDWRINTSNPNSITSWENKFVSRLFLYLDEKQVWNTFNSLAYDTEADRYTLTKWRSFDERHDDGTISKTTVDDRNFDYPQYTSDVITAPALTNLTMAGSISDNTNSVTGLLTGVDINDNKSVSERTTSENQAVDTTSGESDQKESWSIPKEVINFATQRFQQMAALKPIDKKEYINWMEVLFTLFWNQSDHYD